MVQKKVLITGYNGFIGRSYINYLRDNYKDSDIYGISLQSDLSVLDSNHFFSMDLTNNKLSNLIDEIAPDTIIHLASQRFGNLEELFTNNVIGTQNLLQSLCKPQHQHCKIVLAGSSAEIGIPPSFDPIDEIADANPMDNYGLTKLMQSKLALKFAIQEKLNVTRLRFFNVIGPGLPQSLLAGKAIYEFASNQIVHKNNNPVKFGDLTSFRDYVDIRDVCKTMKMFGDMKSEGNLFHVGSGIATSGRQLIDLIIEKCPLKKFKLTYEFDNSIKSLVNSQVASIAKISKAVNWSPTYALTDSITDMWKFQLKALNIHEE